MLDTNVFNLKEFMKSYIETHQTCLNTTNPDFILELVKSSTDMVKPFSTFESVNGVSYSNIEENKKLIFQQLLSGINDLDKTTDISQQVIIHHNITKCYFNFIRKNVIDFVPKRIQHKMVYLVLDEFDKHLYEDVFTSYVINRSYDEVLAEEEGVVEERKRIEQMLDAVNKSLQSMIDIQCY